MIVIVGSSVHNQHAEHIWSTIRLYYRLFYYLESMGCLDPTSTVIHLYSLHYVYLPRVNNSLEQFQDGWNHHGIHTADYKSPYQFFTDGASELQQSGLHSLDFFLNVNEVLKSWDSLLKRLVTRW